MSTIKVDAIKTRAGNVPKASDLGLNVTGTVLQVVQQSQVTRYAVSSTSYAAMFTASITPSSTSSKILVSINGGMYNPNHYGVVTVFRGTTSGTDLSGGGTYGLVMVSDAFIATVGSSVLDSPSTTSATTYTAALKALSGTASFGENTSYSHITLTEIAG